MKYEEQNTLELHFFLVVNVGTGQMEVESIAHLGCCFPSETVEGQASRMEPGLCALAGIWEYLF